jgi:hypothetical protein
MDSQHCSRVFPVCCIHTRIGDSSSVGSGVSVGSVVTVGLAMLPDEGSRTMVYPANVAPSANGMGE